MIARVPRRTKLPQKRNRTAILRQPHRNVYMFNMHLTKPTSLRCAARRPVDTRGRARRVLPNGDTNAANCFDLDRRRHLLDGSDAGQIADPYRSPYRGVAGSVYRRHRASREALVFAITPIALKRSGGALMTATPSHKAASGAIKRGIGARPGGLLTPAFAGNGMAVSVNAYGRAKKRRAWLTPESALPPPRRSGRFQRQGKPAAAAHCMFGGLTGITLDRDWPTPRWGRMSDIMTVAIQGRGDRPPSLKARHGIFTGANICPAVDRKKRDRPDMGESNCCSAGQPSAQVGLHGEVKRYFCRLRNLQGTCDIRNRRHGDRGWSRRIYLHRSADDQRVAIFLAPAVIRTRQLNDTVGWRADS